VKFGINSLLGIIFLKIFSEKVLGMRVLGKIEKDGEVWKRMGFKNISVSAKEVERQGTDSGCS